MQHRLPWAHLIPQLLVKPMRYLSSTLLCSVLLTACTPADNDHSIINRLGDEERQLFVQAGDYRNSRQDEQALDLYHKAAKLSDGAVEAHLAIAEMLRSKNRAAESFDMLQEAKKLQPDDPRVMTELGFSHIARQEFSKSVRQFDNALTEDDEQGAAYSGKGVALDLQGQHIGAQEVYRAAIARGVATEALHNNYGLSLIFTGDYDSAIAELEPLVNTGSGTKTMRQNLALAYGLIGDVEAARTYGLRDLRPEQVAANLAFYRRYTVMLDAQLSPSAGGNQAIRSKAIPVAPVTQGEVGYMTGDLPEGGLHMPAIEVIEVGQETFEQLAR